MAIETTPGKLLLSRILPKGVEIPPLDKKNVVSFFSQLIEQYPDQVPKLFKDLITTASRVVRAEAAGSFDLQHLRPPDPIRLNKSKIIQQIGQIVGNGDLDPQKEAALASYLLKLSDELTEQTFNSVPKDNPLVQQVLSGARGNKAQLKRLIGGDTAYSGYKNNIIPIPILNSYSEGVTPAEFWAATYGARRGLASTKLDVAASGYLLKLLVRATHRLLVTDVDSPQAPPLPVGLPVDIDDPDNEGALLAVDVEGYPKNTPLTTRIIEDLKAKGYTKLLIRSPITTLSARGIYARDAGLREDGKLPPIGSLPGITAAQAIGERLAQTTLGSKHVGGLAEKESGFEVIERLVNIPKQFKGGAVHATVAGKVTKIGKNELGQTIVYINDQPHEINPGYEPIVKEGDEVELGDPISDGIPNPAILVAFKGIGEGRRLFTELFRQQMQQAGLTVNRRNVEFLARGLIDHVEITEPFDDYLIGDVVPYSAIAASWQPREDSVALPILQALDYYIEVPVLHYTIGTKITPSVIKTLKQFGIDKVIVNKNPPPFKPHMVRAAAILEFDPNWVTRLYGSNQLRVLLRAAQEGAEAPLSDTSFVLPKTMGIDLAQWSKTAR